MAHICVKDIDVMDLDDGCWDGALHCKGGMDVSGWRAPVKRQAGRRMGREEGGRRRLFTQRPGLLVLFCLRKEHLKHVVEKGIKKWGI